jgi:hypothetical protein
MSGVWIIAGHYRAAREHAREHGLGREGTDWRYVAERNSLRGWGSWGGGPVELVEAHGANQRRDYDEIRAYVACLNASGDTTGEQQ